MSPGIKETNGLSLPEAYKASLEQHIEQGGWSLVCRDEELCKHIEDILKGQSTHDCYLTHGLDVLSVMEESLRCPVTARAGLKGLARAFEVLELASLNLYLYPWRKEYRIIKTYSGMFTHHVRPALSMEQVVELFGLLGYRASAGASGEQELRLGTAPVRPDDLLSLACSFFTARCECQLLLTSLESLRRPQARTSEWGLRLVQERRRGPSLQVALQSVQRSLGVHMRPIKEVCSDASEVDEDLYTGEGDGGSRSPESKRSHRPLKQSHSSPVLCTGEASSQTGRLCVSTLNYQISSPSSPGGGARHEPASAFEGQTFQNTSRGTPCVSQKPLEVCSCVESGNHYNRFCQQCNTVHCSTCAVLDYCEREVGHNISFCSEILLPEAAESKTKHIKLMSPKDKRSPPGFPERHFCLDGKDKPHVTCRTCRRAHDCLCEDGQRCVQESHELEYQLEPSKSMPLHQCCASTWPRPQFACLSCKIFHSASCPDGASCKQTHSVRELMDVCESCSRAPEVLCKHCCTQLCKECWYKSPLQCLCGNPFDYPGTAV
ncbi:spermatogenesis associated 2-like [Sardina pilchardus]|uniref:spermatogenesis associated 2-like n=1 Tax=Sardina pilchardus TaxID=27697 RepID=UPI002E0F7ABF